MAKLRIFIADNHTVVREGIKLILRSAVGMEVVGEASDGKSAVQLTLQLQPDLVLMDVSMPKLNGMVATKQIKEALPGTKILALTRHDDSTHIQQMLEAGADAFVQKQSSAAELVCAIHTLMAGKQYLDPLTTAKVTGSKQEELGKLTQRESEILRLVALGYGHKEIAAQLDLSVKTVEIHKANAMRKLNLESRVDVVKYGALVGWFEET
jgi:DNA-binding NarL/FixJ family response regulator